MNRLRAIAVVVSLLSIASVATVAGAVRAAAGAPEPQERQDWLGRMSELSAALTRVFVNVLPEDKKRTRADDAQLLADAKKLAALAKAVHSLAPSPPGGPAGANAAPDADPSLALIAKLFVDETDRMVKAIERGRTQSARDLAAGTATFCIGCHTRSDRLRALVPAPSAADLSALHPLDRAELLIATHRFDDARKELDALLANDRFASEDIVGWRRAVTRALVLEVRTSRSPDGALALVERILNGPVPAVQSWADADGWRRSLKAWKSETGARPTRPDAALREARRLLDEAEATPRVPGDRSADVLYLRATALLHDALAAEQAAPARARAFSLLSVSYGRLRDLGVWSLARLYDEACVQQAPNTDLARECYERYAANVRETEADKNGKLSADVKAHLDELAKVAGVAPRAK